MIVNQNMYCNFVLEKKILLNLNKECVMVKRNYRVWYRIESATSATNASATIMLFSASESEAIAELKKRGSIGWDKTVIILDIVPA